MNFLFKATTRGLTLNIILLLTIGAASAQTNAAGAAPGADTNAAPSADTSAAPSVNPAVVRYLGAQDDMLIFNVSYYNPDGKKFVVLITDQQGNQLYQDMFRDKSFCRQFKLPRTDKDLLTFVFRNGQDAPVEKRFVVNVNSHLVREVAIKKL